jgi:hypothetical protein
MKMVSKKLLSPYLSKVITRMFMNLLEKQTNLAIVYGNNSGVISQPKKIFYLQKAVH